MTHPVMRSTSRIFDSLEDLWESLATQRRIATVLIRPALTAPRVIDARLGVAATLFAISLTVILNRAESREFPLSE